ncbi:MAG: glycosyltransferase [Bacteroidota bacterium]
MKVSVIIPTYNGAHKISNILQALTQQTYTDFETIVVIDGSTDNTQEVIESFKNKLPHLKVIVQENKGRGAVRNRGAKEANGDLFVFFDDDMIPLNNCIEEHIKHHQKFPNTINTGDLAEDSTKCKTDIQKYKAYLSGVWSKTLSGYIGKPLKKERIFITAANFSILKNTFETLNGFDENLNDIEDFDLAVRAYKANINMYYSYNAFAWHNEYITCQSYIKRQRQYSIAIDQLEKNKPELYSEFQSTKIKTPKGLKYLIFLFFAANFWIWTIDKCNWLIILPKKLRYKIYDLTITSNGVFFPNKISFKTIVFFLSFLLKQNNYS